jgi:hypothetical protein
VLGPKTASKVEVLLSPVAFLMCAKGQLISKGLFVFFNSPKKRTKNFCPSRLGQKLTFSSSFLGELKTLKFPFEIN